MTHRKNFYSARQAARLLEISYKTALRWIEAGKLDVIELATTGDRRGVRYRVTRAELRRRGVDFNDS
jgi:predicted site-specific integrase-resolvase